MLFLRFFYGLRRAGLPVGVLEWQTLLQALRDDVVSPSFDDFYSVARALLVKDESQYDTYDQVFLQVFAGQAAPREALGQLLDWLKEARARPELDAEQLAKLTALPLEELRRHFEERLKEQKERHDGGNRWIGTGGTSPFGHSGVNPGGVRVGGASGGRSAIQVATARQYQAYRKDRVLDTRALAVALKKLRKLARHSGEPELDIDASIHETCAQAGELSLVFQPPRENQARVLLLMDVGGSMDPFAHLAETLFSAAYHLDHWKSFDAYFFHNCVYERLEDSKDRNIEIKTEDLFKRYPKESFLILLGDAFMAPSELIERFGAIDYVHRNETSGLGWLYRLRQHFHRAVWLNPMPPRAWHGWTVRIIHQLFPMFPLTVAGVEAAVTELLAGPKKTLPELSVMFPELGLPRT